MKTKVQSVSIKISLFFMLLLTVTVLLISSVFILAVNFSIRSNQGKILKSTIDEIYSEYLNNIKETDIYFDVPFNISFSIFDSEKNILFSNDGFIPVLEDTNNKVKKYFEKDYFSDGNLNILYISKDYPIITAGAENSKIKIVVSIDIEKDLANDFLIALPGLILISIIPVLLFSYIVAAFITKRMTKPFERERQFSNDVSHELKTPLAVINGRTSLLLRWGKEDSNLLNESLEIIKKETKSMQCIIENLSEISKYESGRLKPVITEFSAGELFERLKTESEAFVSGESSPVPENFSIKINLANDFFIKSDEELLHQVFTILISNSLKFNKNNCNIILKAEKKGKNIIFEEQDDGIGIDKNIVPYIFDRFYRGDSSHSKNIPGSGLGLSIAKTIISSLDGNIFVKSSIGEGTIFRIELKLK